MGALFAVSGSDPIDSIDPIAQQAANLRHDREEQTFLPRIPKRRRLNGGEGSPSRTSLKRRFPHLRGEYREFRRLQAGAAPKPSEFLKVPAPVAANSLRPGTGSFRTPNRDWIAQAGIRICASGRHAAEFRRLAPGPQRPSASTGRCLHSAPRESSRGHQASYRPTPTRPSELQSSEVSEPRTTPARAIPLASDHRKNPERRVHVLAREPERDPQSAADV